MTKISSIRSEAELDDLLSKPAAGVVDTLGRLDGDVIVLGVGGKMGPSLARMAKRASDAAGVRRRVIGVSRFSAGGDDELHRHGVDTIRCDLLDDDGVSRLPDARNVVHLAGRKFGSTGDEATTWATNTSVPSIICRKFRHSRIVAFSTGNVYGLTPVERGGSREEDRLHPLGEYAMSCLGRERMFEYFSRAFNIPMALLRLNYACELRYGVLVDLAQRVWADQPIDVTMGHVNIIWQGDANAAALRAFDHLAVPPCIMNVTGPELLSMREVCNRFAELMRKRVQFVGTESATALLSNARRSLERLGPLRLQAAELIEWVADWVMRGGRNFGKPTEFQSRDGEF